MVYFTVIRSFALGKIHRKTLRSLVSGLGEAVCKRAFSGIDSINANCSSLRTENSTIHSRITRLSSGRALTIQMRDSRRRPNRHVLSIILFAGNLNAPLQHAARVEATFSTVTTISRVPSPSISPNAGPAVAGRESGKRHTTAHAHRASALPDLPRRTPQGRPAHPNRGWQQPTSYRHPTPASSSNE